MKVERCLPLASPSPSGRLPIISFVFLWLTPLSIQTHTPTDRSAVQAWREGILLSMFAHS